MTDSILDLKILSETEATEALDAAFQALPPGGTLLFATAGNPRKLIRHFIAHHWGRFAWAPLEEGGEYLSQIGKPESGAENGIMEVFLAEHHRCDSLFAAAENAAQQGDQELAAKLFGQFNKSMERHFTMEEEGFFAEFDRRMGMMGGGPTEVMREEHQQMRGLLRRMEGALGQPELEDFLGACETMVFLMEQHNIKEEQMLYPMADDAFGAEADDLLKRLLLF